MPRSQTADAIVIGGGLHGLSAALHLSLEGLTVVVLEKNYPGRHASGVNAGGVRRLGRHIAEVPLSVAAMEIWHSISDLVEEDCEFVACGQVKVAETAEEMAGLRARAEMLAAAGYRHEEVIGADELREIVPNIAPHCLGALIARKDGAASPVRTVTAFRRRCEALGARVRLGAEVLGLNRVTGSWQVSTSKGAFEAPIIVNAAGAWGGGVASLLGEAPPLEAHAPMLMITERAEPFISPVLGAAGRKLSFKQLKNGTVLIGGGERGDADPQSDTASTRYAGLARSAATVAALFPQLAGLQIQRSWAGLEGVTPDWLPVLCASSAEGVFHSFGYSYHGFQLSPITGRVIADLAMHGQTSWEIGAFRIDRFNSRG